MFSKFKCLQRSRCSVIIIASLVSSSFLFAQNELEVAVIEEDAIEEIAVVANRTATTAADISGSIFVLDQEQLDSLATKHIQEALRSVPGVNFQRGSGQEMLPSIRSAVLTGPGACGSNLIMEEGIPVRGAGLCNVNELFDTHFEQAKRVEILRGAQSAFYGSNGLTGSVNVALASEGTNEISIETGSDAFLRFKTALDYGSPDNSGRFYFTHTDTDSFRDEAGYSQQKLSLRHHYMLNKLDINAGFTLTRLDQETAGFIVGLDSYRDPVLAQQNLNPEAFRDTDSLRAWSAFKWQLNPNQVLEIKPYYRKTDMDFLLHFLPGKPLEENRQNGFGWQSALFTQKNERLNWTLGLDYEQSTGYLKQSQENPTEGSAFLQATIPTGIHYDYKVDTQQLGAFAHVNLQASDKLRLIAGARFEYMAYDYDNRGLDGRTRDDGTECGFGGCRYSRSADSRDSFNHLSPKLEVQYELNDTTALRVSAADSFRAPQATELYRLQREQTSADLDTVRATSYELGLNWRGRNIELDTVLYSIQQRNLIIRDSNFFNIDGQKTDSLGLELGMNYSFNDAWRLLANLNYADHVYASNPSEDTLIKGKQVDTAPRFFGNLTAEYQMTERFSTAIELHKVGSYYLDIDNQSKYSGHSLTHVRATYQLNNQWGLSLRISNLLNQAYAERADFTTFTNERYFPGIPRSIFASLKWSY